MSTIKNEQILLFCHFNKFIKEPGTSLSSLHYVSDATNFEICGFHNNPDILRTKHYFFFKWKNSLITHQALLYDKKSIVAGVTFQYNA